MEEKEGRFLRWPWNVVVYVVLFLVLRLFAVPIILFLLWVQQKNNPHGVAEGYCLSRTRKRLTWMIWALLVLAMSAGLLCMLKVGLDQDRTYWETMDYVTLAVCGIGGPLLLIGGLYLGYIAVRDSFFPEKSALAKSIRNQLPYPDNAPPVEELFAMVDADLKENAQWFGPVGIGREWVLGDGVNKIDRIRGIFVVNELHQHHTQTGIRTSRNMELVLIDDRWQRTVTSFRDLKDLQAAADCLALRVPYAQRGTNGENTKFWTMDESARENFEREFRKKQSLRASEQAWREASGGGTQDMILQHVHASDRQQEASPRSRPSQAKLSLVYASGAAENHTTFTDEDVQIAAEGIVDGTYQLVDLTHSVGYLWIRVTAGDKRDGCCTVEATKPEGENLERYMAKLPPREAAAWLTGYPHGQYLPGGKEWKRVKT